MIISRIIDISRKTVASAGSEYGIPKHFVADTNNCLSPKLKSDKAIDMAKENSACHMEISKRIIA